MGRISNVHSMLNARYGFVGTDNGCVWGECITDGNGFCGWIRPKSVIWCRNE